jgi:hypothetical protein
VTGGKDSGYTLATAIFEISQDGVTWQLYGDPAAAPVFDSRTARPSS